MSANNDELRQIVTDALVGMISGVTGLVPPTGPGSIPDFVQAPIDRAVEKISSKLLVSVPEGWSVYRDSTSAIYVGVASGRLPGVWLYRDGSADERMLWAYFDEMLSAVPADSTVKQCLSVQPVKAAPDDSLTAAVDAAMIEMQNISPPLRRSECERLIRAALRVLRAQQGGDA